MILTKQMILQMNLRFKENPNQNRSTQNPWIWENQITSPLAKMSLRIISQSRKKPTTKKSKAAKPPIGERVLRT